MSLSSQLGTRFRITFFGEIITVISGALLITSLARLLEVSEYGLLFLAISIFEILRLFTQLGVGKSAARYVSEYKLRDPGQIPHIIRTSIQYNLISIGIVSIIVITTRQQLVDLINEPQLESYVLLGILYLIFGTFTVYVRDILQGFEAIGSAALTHVVNYSSRLFFAISLVTLGYGALGAFGGYIVSSAAATVVGFLLIYTRLSEIEVVATSIEEGLSRRIAEYAIPITASDAANVLDHSIDTVLVGFFLTPVAVSYYVIGNQIIHFIEAPAEALGFTLSPTFGAEKATGNIDRAARTYETALVHSLLLYIPAAAGLILISEPLIEIVFTADYMGAVPVLQILGLYAVLQTVTKLTTGGLDFLGRARSRAITKGVTSVLNVGLNIILIPLIGVIGAAISTVITYSIYTFVSVYIIHTELNLRIRYLAKNTLIILSIAAVMSIAVSTLLIYITGWITLFLIVAIGAIIWISLSIFVGLLDLDGIISVLTH